MPDVLQPAPLTGRWNKRVYYDYQLYYIIHRLTILYICTEEPKARTSTPSSPWGSCESCGLSRPLNGCPSWRYVFQFVTNPVHSEGRLGPQLASIRHAFTSQIHLHYVKNELIYLFQNCLVLNHISYFILDMVEIASITEIVLCKETVFPRMYIPSEFDYIFKRLCFGASNTFML